MKKPGASQGQSASELISKRIAELGDRRGVSPCGAFYIFPNKFHLDV
jgi:hypothetical protein